jgi:hypothetical protein
MRDWNMEQSRRHERIRFETPSFSDFSMEGLCRVDMHCHTNHSDAPVSVADALRHAERNHIGIAVTDHNQVSGSFYRTSIEKKKQKSPYLAIRGSTSDILEWASEYACVCSAAHPYGYLLFNKGIGRCVERDYLPEELIARFDAIEVVSGGMPRSENIKAVEMAEKYHRGFTGGTDAHLLQDYGRVLTCAVSETVDEFLDAVTKHRNFVVGKEKSLAGKSLMGALIAPRYIQYLLPSLAIHYEQNMPRLQRFILRMKSSKK